MAFKEMILRNFFQKTEIQHFDKKSFSKIVTELGIVFGVSDMSQDNIQAVPEMDWREDIWLIGVKATELHAAPPF
jgi:hypothetical protein